jgi:hypothetical protein
LTQRVITKFGVPKALITDQGTNFTSELIKAMCKLLHVRKIQTTGFHPQSNGRLERVHSTISRMLSHFVNRRQTDWDEYLPYITMAYNSQCHESTGYSPYELVFGRKMEVPLEGDLAITDGMEIFNNYIETLRERLKAAHEAAAQRKAWARGRNERQYNAKAKETRYEKGQLVFLHVPSIGRHRTKKLSKLWKGPYPVVKVLSPLTLILKIRKREVVVHVNRVKPCPTRKLGTPRKQGEGTDETEGSDEEETGEQDNAPLRVPSTSVTVAEPNNTQRPRRTTRVPARYTD